ncbi:MAG: hypothetical protein WC838_05595 [Candidatus Margulisiibacteriota bacterium]|jgi:hypothetical protein
MFSTIQQGRVVEKAEMIRIIATELIRQKAKEMDLIKEQAVSLCPQDEVLGQTVTDIGQSEKLTGTPAVSMPVSTDLAAAVVTAVPSPDNATIVTVNPKEGSVLSSINVEPAGQGTATGKEIEAAPTETIKEETASDVITDGLFSSAMKKIRQFWNSIIGE